MADREYLIEVILSARDQMSRAFAEATAEIEGFDKVLEAQTARIQANREAQRGWAKELEAGMTSQQRLTEATEKGRIKSVQHAEALQQVEKAQRGVVAAENAGDEKARISQLGQATKAHENLVKVIQEETGANKGLATIQANAADRRAALAARSLDLAQKQAAVDAATEQREKAAAAARLQRARQDIRNYETQAQAAQKAADDAERWEQKLSNARLARARKDMSYFTATQRIQQQAARDAERAAQDEIKAQRDIENAYRKVEQARRAAGIVVPIEHMRGGFSEATRQRIGIDPQTYALAQQSPQTQSALSLSGALGDVQNKFKQLDASTSGFDQHIRNAFGFAIVTLIQPFATLLVGLVGTMGALASAAIAAGTAIAASFVSAMVEGIPVMGLFTVAMQRLQNVMGLVQGLLQQQQAAWIAQYTTMEQTRLGINPIIIAQHSYSDALFAQRMAVIAVNNSELSLNETRLQATRQLQDLIFQEVQAKLQAEASALAITDAQKALQLAIATGGDVQQAQLGVAQAQASHTQAVVQAQRAIQDAARGSLARQQIAQTVRQAELAVVQARRAVVDSNFAVAQARAGVTQAIQASHGYNLATAAQLAYLRSQMSETEKALAGNILRILQLFRGANAYTRPLTDAILAPFVALTGEIYRLFRDPKVFAAALQLSHAIGNAFKTIFDTIFTGRNTQVFISLLHDAAQNLGPLARIAGDMFKIILAVVQAAAPYLHQFLGFLASLAGQFAGLATSTRGKNWLSEWFKEAYTSLEAFIKLGVALARLVASIIGFGGGARTGVSIITDITKKLNQLTDDINNKHSKAFKDLQELWSTAKPALQALATVLGAVAQGFLSIAGSKQGRQELKNVADLVAHVLVPAFVQFARNMGAAVLQLLNFLNRHPALQRELVDLIAFVATFSVGSKAIRLIFGPLATLLGLFKGIAGILKTIKDLDIAKAFTGIGKSAGAAIPVLGKIPGISKLPGVGAGAAAAAGPGAGSLAGAPGLEAAGGAGAAEAGLGTAGIATGIGLVIAAIVALAAWTGTLGKLWNAIKAPFVAIWDAIRKPIQGLVKDWNYMMGAFGGTKHVIDAVRDFFRKDLTDIFKIFQDVFGGLGKIVGTYLGLVIKIIGDIFRIIGDIARGKWGAVAKDFLNIGKAIISGLQSGIKDLVQIVIKVFVDLVNAILNFLGIGSPSKKFQSIGQSMVDGIMSAVTALPNLFLQVGEDIVKFLVKGLEKAPGALVHALESLIPKPLRGILSGIGHVASGLLHGAGSIVSSIFGQEGGPIPGYGGGDTQPAMLEPGEHIFTKEEVRAAGGHGAIYAIRRALGGGRQGGPYGYQVGGAAVGPGGTYSLASITLGTPGFTLAAINTYNRAQAIISERIRNNAVNIVSGLKIFLHNYDLVGGDGGLFDLAAQAIDNFNTQMTNAVTLAENGVKIVGNKLLRTIPETALQAAQATVTQASTYVDNLEKLLKSEHAALSTVDAEITKAIREHAPAAILQRLRGAQQDITNRINSLTSTLGTALQDQFTAIVNAFQAQIDQVMRSGGTLARPGNVTLSGAAIAKLMGLGGGTGGVINAAMGNLTGTLKRVGPGIALGLAQMAQTIAQTLGNPQNLQTADQAVITASQGTVNVLQQAYAAAAKKAQKDPRWQSTADNLLSQLEDATTQLAQAQATALTDAISSEDTKAQLQTTALDIRDRLAQVVAGFGNQMGALQLQVGTSRARAATLQQQIGVYQGLLDKATAEGNTSAVTSLTEKIQDLTAQVAEANLQTQQLITQEAQLAATMISTRQQTEAGFVSTAQGIFSTLGQITGSLNLPQQINTLKGAIADLTNQVPNIVKATQQAVAGGGLGAFTGQAAPLLSQLTQAFQAGPMQYATTLQQLGPALASLAAAMPPDIQSVFEQLIQNMSDNRTALVDNTQALQTLQATALAQDFTSSAWSMFRTAIFNGLGQLLPQYAMTVPSLQVGGYIRQSGLMYGHKGEQIVPANVKTPHVAAPAQSTNHFHFTEPMEVADPVHLGSAIAFRLAHDPNSR